MIYKALTGIFALIFMMPLAIADIAEDLSNGVELRPTTENAKDANTPSVAATEELIQAGIDPVDAVITVCIVYGLTPEEMDEITTAAINLLPPEDNTTPLLALYSTECGLKVATRPGGAQGLADTGSSGGGPCSGTSNCSVSPN